MTTIILDLAPAFPHPIPEVPADVVAKLAGAYVPASGDLYREWTGSKRPDFKPSERQQPIVAAVQIALREKLFYSKDVLARVITLMAVPEDVAAKGRGKVEGGDLGMDCFYAREHVESSAVYQAELAAALAMKLEPGMKLGTMVLTDGKRNTGMQITAALDGHITFTIEGKRGALPVKATASALGIRRAINRAFERGNRKDNCTMLWPTA